jgi:hypothetical protein
LRHAASGLLEHCEKEQIAPNECWIIESGRVEDIQDEDTDENTGEEHYLTVYQCFDVTQTL